MATHPANAVFVSKDGKVSFDENGRKLDSNGNVVWKDRQGLRGASARVRPEIIAAYEAEAQAQQSTPQAQPPVQQYRPPAVMEQQPASPWAGVSNWNTYTPPGGQSRQQPPAWEPPPSGLGMTAQQPPAWEPPPSGLGNWNTFQPQRPPQVTDPQSQQAYDLLNRVVQQGPQQQNWRQYKPPRSYNPYMP